VRQMQRFVEEWKEWEPGQALVDYATIFGLVAVGILSLLLLVGGDAGAVYKLISPLLPGAPH
jgi:Flp pilus assembly pilin Flp